MSPRTPSLLAPTGAARAKLPTSRPHPEGITKLMHHRSMAAHHHSRASNMTTQSQCMIDWQDPLYRATFAWSHTVSLDPERSVSVTTDIVRLGGADEIPDVIRWESVYSYEDPSMTVRLYVPYKKSAAATHTEHYGAPSPPRFLGSTDHGYRSDRHPPHAGTPASVYNRLSPRPRFARAMSSRSRN